MVLSSAVWPRTVAANGSDTERNAELPVLSRGIGWLRATGRTPVSLLAVVLPTEGITTLGPGFLAVEACHLMGISWAPAALANHPNARHSPLLMNAFMKTPPWAGVSLPPGVCLYARGPCARIA